MKKYTKPSLEAVAFECKDIITASAEPRFIKNGTNPGSTTGGAQWDPEWDITDY